MSNISAAAVKSLRDRTNAPMMDCKIALTEAGGDLEKAADILRKKNKAIQDKKGDRETAEGRVAAFIDNAKKVGALVEVRCESAPVAKSEPFTQLANDIARQVALKEPASIDALLAQPFVDDAKKTIKERIGDVVGVIKENMKPARLARFTGLTGAYIHHDSAVGAMVEVEGQSADAQLLKEVCMHITFKNPIAMSREDVSPALIAKETEIVKARAASTGKGKPANIIEKIAEGQMKNWFAENVLLEQPFVKDDSKTVGDLLKGANLKLVKFVRFKVGERS